MSKIDRRTFIAAAGASSLMLTTEGFAAARREGAKPNVVFILVDDMGWGDIRAYNKHSAVPTPNLDRLAGEGMRFNDMHSSSAVCTPSRYSILTGRYCWRTRLKSGVLNGYDPSLIERGRLTVAGMLKKAGYYTAGVGKWHLGLGEGEPTDYGKPLRQGPIDHGFDYYFGIPASLDMAPYLYFENDRVVEQATTTTAGQNQPRGVFWRGGPIAPGFQIPEVVPTLTDKAIEVIQQRARQKQQPFFLYFSMPSPHTPWVPLPEYKGKSAAGDYGDYVHETDAMIGKVLTALEQQGLADNTLIVMTSDNGADWHVEDGERYAHRANGEWRGRKADVWEAGHRVPFIVRWPGHIKANSVSNEMASLTDFMATMAAILDVPLPADAAEDSYNMLPAFQQTNTRPIRTTIVEHSLRGVFVIREGNWKLVLGLGSGGFSEPRQVEPSANGIQGQLFDLAADPQEVYNLYAERPDIVQRLTETLQRYQQDGRSRPQST